MTKVSVALLLAIGVGFTLLTLYAWFQWTGMLVMVWIPFLLGFD